MSYGVFSSRTSYVSRAHPERIINDLEDAWHQVPVAMVHGSIHEQSHFYDGDETMGDILDDKLLFVNLDRQFVKRYANFILKMQEKHLILYTLCNLYWGMYSERLKWLAPIRNTE